MGQFGIRCVEYESIVSDGDVYQTPKDVQHHVVVILPRVSLDHTGRYVGLQTFLRHDGRRRAMSTPTLVFHHGNRYVQYTPH
jgi:hypothetical protein